MEVKITKLYGDPVTKAVVRPETAGNSCKIVDGEVIVVISKPALFTVDINGQMDDQDNNGRLPDNGDVYSGPPIHTFNIFANPFISKPIPWRTLGCTKSLQVKRCLVKGPGTLSTSSLVSMI